MTRNRVVQIIAALVLIASMSGAAMLVPAIDHQRQRLQLTGLGLEKGRNLGPKEVIANALLAVFRGVAVDYLWYRANELKEQGKFFEINQLSETITSLQPRFPQVWSFQAWNMAYNISVQTHTADERWDWVNKGIAILRDKGIPFNPRAIRLYRELAWIFFHKVGQYSDDMHWYYKQRLAQEWQEVLGAPTQGATTRQVIDAMQKIVDAKDTLAAQEQAYPAMTPLLAKLRAMGFEIDTSLLLKMGQVLMTAYAPDTCFLGPGAMAARLPDGPRQLYEVMLDPALSPGLDPLLSHLRKRTLIDKYKMDPSFMLELTKLHGPIDWRHPAAHGLYWSSMGVKMAGDLRNKKDIDLLNTYRGILHALQELMFRGQVTYDPLTHRIDLAPDLRFIDAYNRAMDRAGVELDLENVWGNGTLNAFGAGHENFLLTAVVYSYLYGDEALAQKYYDEIRDTYGSKPENIAKGIYTQPLKDLVYHELVQNLDIMYYARQAVDSFLTRAVAEGLLRNRPDIYNRLVEVAARLYQAYQKKYEDTPEAPGGRSRMALPPWGELLSDTYVKYFREAQVSPLTLFQLWSNTPPQTQRAVFDRLQAPMRGMAEQMGFDPLKAFPEPPDMEQYRKDHPAQAEQPGQQQGPAPVEKN